MKRNIFFLAIFILLFSNITSAADRYWIASTASNWNNTANWSATSGGSGGATVPGVSEIARFDGGGLGDCQFDINIIVLDMQVAHCFP